uniref:Odorant receptor n=1 Tax=Phlebotomus papatasi TaxID=29031 RepID=A0A3F2ZEQ0_PHLPP
MSVSQNLEIFNKIKPKLEFAIAIATFYVTSKSFWQYILIKTPFVSTALCLISTTLNIANTFEGRFTGNLAMSLLFCSGSLQVLSFTFFMRYHRNNILELLDKVKSLHSNFENKELHSIAENTLTKFSNIWETCYKLRKTLVTLSVICFTIINTIKRQSGVITQLPLFPINYPYYTQIMLLVQFIFISLLAVSIFYTGICIAFFGFEIMAASDILYDYISANKDRIQKDPDFLKIITIRHCEIVDTVKRFNKIISLTNLVQFVTSALLSFAIFFFVRLNPKNPVGYILALGILFQLFLPCLFGEYIKIKMERLSTTLYLTNWPDLKLKDQKSFVIVLGMIQREYGLRAAEMYDVNIYTFIEIVKIATSWCAFIFTLVEANI